MTGVGLPMILAGVAGQAQHDSQTTQHRPPPTLTDAGQSNWPLHNLDVRSTRYSELAEITTANVDRLALAWTFEAESNILTSVLRVDGHADQVAE